MRSKRLMAGLMSVSMLMTTGVFAASPATENDLLFPAAISGPMPRFSIIHTYGANAFVSGSDIVITANLSSYGSSKLSIEAVVMKDGKNAGTYSNSKTGEKMSLTKRAAYEKGHRYKVIFTFRANGEKHTVEKTVK